MMTNNTYISIGSLLRTLGLGIGLGLSVPLSMNLYQNHNVDYTIGEKRILRKVDGIMSNTKIEINNDGNIKLIRSGSFFDRYRSYTDERGDGSLDIIYLGGNLFGRGPESESMSLSIYDGNLESHPDLLANSEREFREQLRRFGLSDS